MPDVDLPVHLAQRFDGAWARASPVVLGRAAHLHRILDSGHANNPLGFLAASE
jgi:hypothetical protein